MKLDDQVKSLVTVLLRSNDVGDGWRNVSNTLRKITLHIISLGPELFETREMGGLQVRLSDRGEILKDYL